MLQQAKELQNEAIKKLLKQKGNSITFKAPTGSGKTYMMAKFMNEVLARDNGVVFLVTTLSKGGLGKQNYEKFMEYKSHEFKNLDPYFIATDTAGEEGLYIGTNANVYVLETAKSNKAGKLMRGPLLNFLKQMTYPEGGLFNGKGKKIYLIKDECHIQTSNIDELSEYYTRIYNFSATPKLSRGQNPNVEITNSAAESAKLIKHVEFDTEADFETAVKNFEKIKVQYRNLLGVNPCMIVQISNKEKADEELEQIVFKTLNLPEHTDLKWALIVGDKSKCDTNDVMKAKKLPVEQWRRYAKDPLSLLDVIIFKLTISEGWDIPRACMLYQIRETQSEQLDEQVLGRIRRNPRLLDFETLNNDARKLAMTAWAYGEKPEDNSNYVTVKIKRDVQNEVKIKTTRLKPFEKENSFRLSAYKTKNQVTNKSIFELYDELKNSPDDIRNAFKNEIKTTNEWFSYTGNLKEIISKYNEYSCDYSENMEVAKDENGNELLVSFPNSSFFLENNIQKNLPQWVWAREKEDLFSFDSEAEKDWAMQLLFLIENNTTKNSVKSVFGTYMFGKNFLDNSEIKFEYFMNGNRHFSFPDFVMKDAKDRIHIFEVKSINKSDKFLFDEKEYNDKIYELKRCYKQASVITNNIFYLPIKEKDEWKIIRYMNGIEENITLNQFISFINI